MPWMRSEGWHCQSAQSGVDDPFSYLATVMDNQHPPPGNGDYFDPSWHVLSQDNEEMGYHGEHLTSSQTEMIQQIIPGIDHLLSDHSIVDQNYSVLPFNGLSSNNSYTALVPAPDQVRVDGLMLPTVNTNVGNVGAALESWPGDLNFRVEFSASPDKTKATPWVYSNRLKKLFVSLDKACPISFTADTDRLHEYQVRGMIVLSSAGDFQEHVNRCVMHRSKDPTSLSHIPMTSSDETLSTLPDSGCNSRSPVSFLSSDNNNTNLSHIFKCDTQEAVYNINSVGLHSVAVALSHPPPGSRFDTHCYRFMCLSSCQGSLNRRPAKLIFTLETLGENPIQVGRYAVDVRICSCPGRDIKTEEEKEDKEQRKKADENQLHTYHLPAFDQPVSKGKKRKTNASTKVVAQTLPEITLPTTTLPPPSTPAVHEDDNELHHGYYAVRGRRNFETVKDVVDRMTSVFNERFVVEPGRDSNVEGGGVVVVGNESITEDDAHIANKRFKQEP